MMMVLLEGMSFGIEVLFKWSKYWIVF